MNDTRTPEQIQADRDAAHRRLVEALRLSDGRTVNRIAQALGQPDTRVALIASTVTHARDLLAQVKAHATAEGQAITQRRAAGYENLELGNGSTLTIYRAGNLRPLLGLSLDAAFVAAELAQAEALRRALLPALIVRDGTLNTF